MRADAWLVLAALALEACVGYPRWLYARIGHPVVWIGALIRVLDRHWNDESFNDVTRRSLGAIAILLIVGIAVACGIVMERFIGLALVVLIATIGLAQRSLYSHVRDVLRALTANDLAAARVLVGRIVGRDTAHLSQEEVAAAALESLAESFNDAVVAPTFWLFVGGLPGLLAYKATNTADSMIGHLEPRWRMFGCAAARLDDLLNFVPARLAGLLLAIAAQRGFATMVRDASKHASPNAGWPEAALAGGLAIRLGGPARYDGVAHERPTFGDGAPPTAAHLGSGLHIYMRACALLWTILAGLGVMSHAG